MELVVVEFEAVCGSLSDPLSRRGNSNSLEDCGEHYSLTFFEWLASFSCQVGLLPTVLHEGSSAACRTAYQVDGEALHTLDSSKPDPQLVPLLVHRLQYQNNSQHSGGGPAPRKGVLLNPCQRAILQERPGGSGRSSKNVGKM